jgi:hypothetical protein
VLEEVPPTVVRRKKWVRQRIEWCRLQDSSEFRPQPYNELAAFLQRIGHESDARTVRIANRDDLRPHLDRKARAANRFLSWTIGHGYRPGRAVLWGILFVLVGYLVFHLGHEAGLLKKSPRTSGSFSALGYSVDTLIPVVTFGQDQHWSPVSSTVSGQLVQLYMWVHILIGWVLTSLGLLAVTGLVRKD